MILMTRERGFHGTISSLDMEFCWYDFFATEFCICVFLSQNKELNLPFCLLHYAHHFCEFGGMQLCCFVCVCVTLNFVFKSVL